MKVDNPYKNNNGEEYDAVVAITQCLRFKALSKLLKIGLPQEKDDRDYFLKILKDVDNTVLTTKRVKGEASVIDSQLETFNVVNATLNKITHNPFVKKVDSTKPDIKVPTFDREEGESFIGLDSLDIDSIEEGN